MGRFLRIFWLFPASFHATVLTHMSILAGALKSINSAKKRSKRQFLLGHVVIWFLTVMMKNGYIGKFKIIDDHRAEKIVVNLVGRLNKCGGIIPDCMCNSKI